MESQVSLRAATIEGTATFEKAMDVFDAVGASAKGLSQAQLAEQLGLPRTTLYRLLASLVARGLLRRDAQRRVYCLGFKCFEFARRAHDMPDLVAAASVELHALRDLTGETTYLGVLDGAQVVAMERCDGAHTLRSASVLGQAKPVHATSQGKAILSAMSPASRDGLIRDLPLFALTPNTIVDRRQLIEDVRVTAARRWSIDDEEIVPGIRCVGAPVVDVDGHVRGAISVAGPAYRMTLERLHGLGPEVAEAARRIGQQLRSVRVAPAQSETLAVEGNWAFRGAHPLWDSSRQALYWVDALAPTVRMWDGFKDVVLATLDSPIVGLAMQAERLRVWSESGHWTVDPVLGASSLTHLGPWEGAVPTALCAAHEEAYWTCQAVAKSRWVIGLQGHEPSLDNLSKWTLTEPVSALCWDSQRSRLFAIDAGGTEILMMQVGQEKVRRFAAIPAGSGRLSGLALARDGGLWTTLQNGWSVLRFAADGAQEQVLGLPVPKPQDLCLCTDGEERLFVTTAREGVSFDVLHHAPLSGRLFCIPLHPRN